jgi:cell filamentation protein, protein adenylyltransferase
VDFFLEGVEQTAAGAVGTARRLVALFKADEQRVQRLSRTAATTLRVFGTLCQRPLVTLNQVRKRTGMSFPSAAKGMDALMQLSIARELTGQRRNRVFIYDRYLSILNEGTEPL